jgi:hypothetical protein
MRIGAGVYGVDGQPLTNVETIERLGCNLTVVSAISAEDALWEVEWPTGDRICWQPDGPPVGFRGHDDLWLRNGDVWIGISATQLEELD